MTVIFEIVAALFIFFYVLPIVGGVICLAWVTGWYVVSEMARSAFGPLLRWLSAGLQVER